MTGLLHISDFVSEQLPLVKMTKLFTAAGIGALTDHVSLRYILYYSFMQGCPDQDNEPFVLLFGRQIPPMEEQQKAFSKSVSAEWRA